MATFRFEGKHRTRLAEEGIAFMERVTDTLIVIPNQNVFQLIDEVNVYPHLLLYNRVTFFLSILECAKYFISFLSPNVSHRHVTVSLY